MYTSSGILPSIYLFAPSARPPPPPPLHAGPSPSPLFRIPGVTTLPPGHLDLISSPLLSSHLADKAKRRGGETGKEKKNKEKKIPLSPELFLLPAGKVIRGGQGGPSPIVNFSRLKKQMGLELERGHLLRHLVNYYLLTQRGWL